jgi:hypothetical protein
MFGLVCVLELHPKAKNKVRISTMIFDMKI